MAEPRRIGVFGSGWVGLVTGGCLADLGHDVVVRDVLPERIEALEAGRLPFHEPGLPEVLERNRGRIHYTLAADDLADADVLFICVQTPPTYSGDADLSYVWTALDDLPRVERRRLLVMKSTVPVGTGEKVRAALEARGLANVGYVSNPEFLAEGSAVHDFMDPDRIVVGAFAEEDGAAVEALYDGIDAPVVVTDVASAEMIKLAANAFLMTRISFINEIANVCEAVGADVVEVAKGVGLDHRLGSHFLRAGIGYGGSCLTGDETVLVVHNGRVRLVELERLYAEVADGDDVKVVAWDPETGRTRLARVDAVTRREIDGEIIELKTKMGRRVRCTLDHPWVTRSGVKLARDLTQTDWLPLGGAGIDEVAPPVFEVLESLEGAGLERENVIVRPAPLVLEAAGARRIQPHLQRRAVSRSHEIVRSGALRLDELDRIGLSLERATVGTCRNGTYVPVAIKADEAFWRVVGLYIAEGHCSADGARRRLQWSFHPRDEFDLVEEVFRFWAARRVFPSVRHLPTTAAVSISSRILASFWLSDLGLGANCYEQRIPDAIWTSPLSHKRALLAGMWRGDGSWSFVNGGPSVILEYGTVSRELADGLLRLLACVGVVASIRVGRVAKSTRDTYWIRISGANQVEELLEFVPERDRDAIVTSLARQAKRIAPTGYARDDDTSWVRVVDVARQRFTGPVYSLEVPGLHTFVTTGGLVTHNCFPKDSLALKQLASNSGYHFQLLAAVIEVNELQKRRVIQKLQKHLGKLRGKKVALLGLAFKAGTDDMREAPSLVLASRLLAEGAEVRAWDPVARPGELMKGAVLYDTVLEAVRGADAAVIVTEWNELRDLASAEIRDAMARPLIIDGRNLLDPAVTRRAGFAYEGIGRPSSPFEALPETVEPETRVSS
jgi:UDPglucose 6-dehydrogenase